MTIHAMEVLLKNLDDRLARIERILPPLVQKVDAIDASTSGLRALIEDSRSDTRLLAEHVSRLIDQVERER
jgi:hypothetical protein